jgi:hypothetical protein
MAPLLGNGSTLGYRVASTGSYTVIGQLVDLDHGVTIGEVEANTLSSTVDQYLPTLPSVEASFDIQFVPQDPAVIEFKTLLVYPVPNLYWEITYPDTSTEAFTGFPKGFAVSGVENSQIMMANIPIRGLTVPVLSPAT